VPGLECHGAAGASQEVSVAASVAVSGLSEVCDPPFGWVRA